jgi:hypothetical protein
MLIKRLFLLLLLLFLQLSFCWCLLRPLCVESGFSVYCWRQSIACCMTGCILLLL